MVLGIFLPSGDSFKNMSLSGQDVRFKYFYLRKFSEMFSKIYIFSYDNEKVADLPPNIIVVPNKYSINRFLYGFLMPFLNLKKALECDVFRAYHLLGTLPAIMAKIFLGKPYVFNYAYDYAKFAKIENKNIQIVLIKLIHYPAIFLSSMIIATTREMSKLLPAEKNTFIPNGVDVRLFRAKFKKNTNKKLKIISVGRLEAQKNYLALISAIKGLAVSLLIIGSGSLKSSILNHAKKSKVNLVIIDKIDNLKLPTVLGQANIFVLPSLIEGPNKAILEAMACGLPTVGTNVSGINEIIIDKFNGLLAETNSGSLRNSIQILINKPKLREKFGRNARLLIENKYNLETLIRKEVEVLKKASLN